MVDLKTAKFRAAVARLSEDRADDGADIIGLRSREDHRDAMLRHGVLISEAVTPVLEERLVAVCETLNIPRQSVTAFVYNSADVQADCLIDSPNSCILRFSSGLVNLKDRGEFKFVAGHELGHFLLGHGACAQYLSEGSSEDFMLRRARELSADRIGYLAVGNLEESIQAIIKTASGLRENFLRFDVASFLSQKTLISNPLRGEARNSTHPSMLIRCRALLWFSMSIQDIEDLREENRPLIAKVDLRVIKDLERLVDGQVRLRRVELEQEVVLWKSALLIFHAGSFATDTQMRLADHLGKESLEGVKSFFELYDPDELLGEITKRLNESLSMVSKEFPSSAAAIEDSAFEIAYRISDSTGGS